MIEKGGGNGSGVAGRVDLWLRSLGLDFDPFRDLDAGADPRLYEYLIGDQEFERIWADEQSLVFAAGGGGKSAFRVSLAAACRAGLQDRQLFPIIYRLPDVVVLRGENVDEGIYLRTISQAAAWEMLLYLAYRPKVFLKLETDARRLVKALLVRDLPNRLPTLAQQAPTASDLPRLARAYDPSAKWPNQPSERELDEFWQTLLQTAPAFGRDAPVDLDVWVDLLIGTLGFEAIYVLLDGVDAYTETLADAERTLRILAPLWQLARSWPAQGIYLKAFLPIEFADEAALRDLTPEPSIAIIKWNADRLHQMLQRRLEVASGMRPDSLDRLSSLEVDRLEERLVQAVSDVCPLPRDLLRLVQYLFVEHVERAGPTGRIAAQDVDAALSRYARARPNLHSGSLSVCQEDKFLVGG
jgi:hypothetical protein